MSHGKWWNKNEVLNDIAALSGTRETFDGITAIRDKPQAAPTAGDEEIKEMVLYYGHRGTNYQEDSFVEPDYDTITRTLEMLEERNGSPDYNPFMKREEEFDNILEISKLNPDVEAFVPSISKGDGNGVDGDITKTKIIVTDALIKPEVSLDKLNVHSKKKNTADVCNSSLSNHKELVKKSVGSTNGSKHVEIETSNNISKINSCIDNFIIGKRIDAMDIRELNSDQINKISDQLKLIIDSDSNLNSGSFQSKINKNVALASLTKLHSVQSTTCSEPRRSKIKLLTPEHFKCSISNNSEKQQNHDKLEKANESVDNHNEKVVKKRDHKIEADHKIVKESGNEITMEIKHTNTEPNRKYKQESIEKVNNWLNSDVKIKKESNNFKVDIPTKPKPEPNLHVYPLFKKKAASNSSNASISTSPSRSQTSSPSTIKEYKPSQSANKLYEKFLKDAEKRQNHKETVWTIAQKKMKEKEERMRRKKTEDESNTQEELPSS